MGFTLCELVLILLSAVGVSCNILELGGDFGDAGSIDEPHLVMFYAPWCGHCKALYPIWHEVGNKLSRHPITVARIDATVYRTAAEKYNVRGFPTIRLIGNDRTIDYIGDRTTEALTDFAIKGSRPLLPTIASPGNLRDLQRSDDVLFLSLGTNENTHTCLQLVAAEVVHEAIIAEVVNSDVVGVNAESSSQKINDRTALRSDLSASKSPSLLVLKDNQVYEYTGSVDDCLVVVEWIKSERFAAFQVGSYPVIHPLLFLNYVIVFYYGENAARVKELRDVSAQRQLLAGDYYFIHVDQAEFIENLISAFADVDSIVIYDPESEQYSYTYDPAKTIKECVEEFSNGKAELYGGTGFIAGAKKVGYRLAANVLPMFYDHPFIMGIVIVIPIGLILLCCCDEMRSKDDPIRQVRSSQSHMELLFNDNSDKKDKEGSEDKDEKAKELNEEEEQQEEEQAEEKDEQLKKTE